MLCDRNEKDDDGECHRQRSLAADEGCSRKAEPTPLRNEASLNCVSLRSELDGEVSCETVKGQDERRRSGGALDSLATHQPRVYAARHRTSKVSREDRQKGDAVGRPSCQSSLLSDPNANFSVKMWRRSNIRRAATSALTFVTFS